MRNLRKVLALVLTLAMMLSVMVMNVGAFTDDKNIQHKEAAAVANAIEVLKGYEDGSYGPEKTLTRAEAATMAARLLETPEKADALKTTSAPFADVAADNWAAGYIAYCQSEGIINGVGANKFAPDDTLTVAQFAKILLGALGYKADREGMTGAAWAINTAKLAQKNDILEDVNAAFDGDCTRDDAAQMILNLLVADMVEYDDGDINVTTSDGTQVTVNGKGAEKVDANSNDGNIDGVAGGDTICQFAEEYFPDLVRDTGSAETNFGRPDNVTWKYDDDDVYTVSDSSDYDLVATYTEKATKGDLFKVIGKSTVNAIDAGSSTFEIYEDGIDVTPGSVDVTDYFVKNSTKTADCTGNGVLCEVYKDADTDNVRIVLINTYVAQALDDYDEDKGELQIDVNYLPTLAAGEVPLSDEDFDIANYADEDWLLVTVDDDEIASVQPAETVEGTVDSYSSGNSITVDGTAYKLAKNIDSSFDTTPAIESDITLILDQYGFVVGTDDVDSNDEYVYVVEFGTAGVKNVTAAAYFTDGTYEEINVKGSAQTDGAWYTYEQKDDGKYELTPVAAADIVGDNTVTSMSDAVAFATGMKATNTTVFLVMDEDAYEDAADCDVYTGYKNAPTVTNANSVIAVVDDGYCTYVFVDANASAASIKGASDDSTDYMMIFATDVAVSDSNKDSDKNVFYTFDSVLKNGEEASVNVIGSKAVSGGSIALTAGQLYTGLTYDEDGYVDGWDSTSLSDYATAVDDGDEYSADNSVSGNVTESNGVLTIDTINFSMADSYKIFVITDSSSAAGDYDTVTVAKLAKDYKTASLTADIYCALNDDGDVTAMYIVK